MWSGQIIETSHNLTPKGSWGREIHLLHGFFFFWLVKYHSIWPDMILLVIKLTFNSVNLQASHQLFCWNVFVRLCHWHQRAGVPHSSVEMWKKNIRWVIFCTISLQPKSKKTNGILTKQPWQPWQPPASQHLGSQSIEFCIISCREHLTFVLVMGLGWVGYMGYVVGV